MRISILIAAVFLILSCAGPQPEPSADPAEVRQAIEAVNAQLAEAFSRGDAAAFAAFYTPDGTLMPPNAEPSAGRQAIEESFGADFSTNPPSLKLTTADVEVHGDTAIESGNYSISFMPPGQEEAVEDHGKYLVVWKKQSDGSWKLHWDIWNSNLSPAVEEASPEQ